MVEPGGQTLFTRDNIMDGQETFLREGLMEYGSIFGHGAYLGPDFTADYLRRAAPSVRDSYGGAASDRALQRTITDFRRNRYDPSTGTLTYTGPQAEAFRKAPPLSRLPRQPDDRVRVAPNAIDDPVAIHRLTAYFSWAAWATSAERPGHNYSYTNNWPPSRWSTTSRPRTWSCGA